MAKIAASTILRHPETGAVVALLAGEEAPAWAVGLISNDEVLKAEPKAQPKAAPGRPTKA